MQVQGTNYSVNAISFSDECAQRVFGREIAQETATALLDLG
jgi:hypothetical protein